MPQTDSRWRESDIQFVLSVSIACQCALKRFHEERALYLSKSEAGGADWREVSFNNVLVEEHAAVRLSGYEEEEEDDEA